MDKREGSGQAARQLIEGVLRNRILYIGSDPPPSASAGRDCVQLYSGCPNDLIDELCLKLHPSHRAAWEQGMREAEEIARLRKDEYKREGNPDSWEVGFTYGAGCVLEAIQTRLREYPVPSASPALHDEFNRNEAKRQRRLAGYKECPKCGTEWLGDAPCPKCIPSASPKEPGFPWCYKCHMNPCTCTEQATASPKEPK